MHLPRRATLRGHAVFADQEGLDYLPHCAAGVFCLCARGLVFFGVLIASITAFNAAGNASPDGIRTAGFIVRLLLWPGIVGTALLSIAMWYFWLSFDNSGWWKKAIWFLPLYFLLPFGPALYYFFVYRLNGEVAGCS
jgi:hypothetical protein